jgi:hypothetical protein
MDTYTPGVRVAVWSCSVSRRVGRMLSGFILLRNFWFDLSHESEVAALLHDTPFLSLTVTNCVVLNLLVFFFIHPFV